ncbi:type II toxin-antitoxin system PemK/MazF family toxin [Isoptericola sp. NPDC057391]|uniref:type II toxin-antitoxin system PemK/MazF family toxin n=1 Tax=Isoptericola sp. NPDC057391 TaxID=3346117 RepID=UPI003628008F
MRRGDVWEIDLMPVPGSEADQRRPAVIVSNDARNRTAQRSGRGVRTVVPLTSNTARVLPFQVLIAADDGNGLGVDSKAQAEQVRSVDLARFGRRLGALSAEQVAALDDALLLHLALG